MHSLTIAITHVELHCHSYQMPCDLHWVLLPNSFLDLLELQFISVQWDQTINRAFDDGRKHDGEVLLHGEFDTWPGC